MQRDELEWKDAIGRKCKGGVVKIIGTIGDAVESTSKQDEQSFDDKSQELLKSRKVIASCDASVKNGFIGT